MSGALPIGRAESAFGLSTLGTVPCVGSGLGVVVRKTGVIAGCTREGRTLLEGGSFRPVLDEAGVDGIRVTGLAGPATGFSSNLSLSLVLS